MLAENLVEGEPRNAITFNTEVLMEGLKVKIIVNGIVPQCYQLNSDIVTQIYTLYHNDLFYYQNKKISNEQLTELTIHDYNNFV